MGKPKILLFLVAAVVMAYAAEYRKVEAGEEGSREMRQCLSVTEHAEERAYCRTKPSGTISISRIKRWRADGDYKAAMKALHDRRHYKSVTVLLGDPESKSVRRRGVQRLPDYEKAARLFYEASRRGGNALAAYVGRSIILSYLGTNKRENAKMAAEMAKVLYGDKSCEGYVAYGDTLRDGFAGEKGLKKAPAVYKAGYKVCKDIGYYGNVLGSRIDMERMATIRKGSR